MNVPDGIVAALRALLVGQHDEHERLLEPYAQTQHAGYVLLIIGAFREAAKRHFGEEPLQSEVIRYVGQVRGRSNVDDLNPVTAEKLLRSALGDTAAAMDVAPEAAAVAQLDLLIELVKDLAYDDTQLTEFLATAKTNAEAIRIES